MNSSDIPGSFSKLHGLALIEMISLFTLIGFGVWFALTYIRFTNRSYNPTSDEKTIGIDYNFQAITTIYIVINVISVIVYAVCGGVTLVEVGVEKATLSAAIITGILSIVLFLNGGMAYDAQNKLDNNYTDSNQQTAVNNLNQRNIPYDNLGASSFASGSVQFAMMIVILCYYYLVVVEDKPPIPSPRRPAPTPQPPISSNYLKNDSLLEDRLG